MRLLIVSQYFHPENFRINELVRDLAAAGHQLTVVTGKPNYPDGKLFPGYRALGVQRDVYEGAEVVRLPLVPRGRRSGLRLAINYLSFVLSGYLLAPLALHGRTFDAVFVYAPSPLLQALPAVFLAWLRRAPLIVWVQDLWPESLAATGYVRNRILLRLVEAVVRYIYRHTDSILIQSEGFRAPIARLVLDPRRVRYYPNSAEAIFGALDEGEGGGELPAAIRRRFSIVFAGNIGSAQAVATIVDAAELLAGRPEIHFFLVGSGSESAWVESEVQRRKLRNLTLTGRLPVTDMPAIFSAASALLVSLKDEAIFAYTIPGKIQSYLAVGRPIIAAVNGEGARVIADAGAGITCPAENARALADAVLQLFAMPAEQRARLGENGRRYFLAHFEQGRLVDELVRHIDAVIAAGGATQ
jgi:glycosyltransferase involved in cell wall biosynthesis